MFKRHHADCTIPMRYAGSVRTITQIVDAPRTCEFCYGRIESGLPHSASFIVKD